MNKLLSAIPRWRRATASALDGRRWQTMITRRFYRWSAGIVRWLWYSTAAVAVLLALVFTVARLWLLPAISDRHQEIVAYLSEQSGYPIQFGQLQGYWDGLNPGLRATDLVVAGAEQEQPGVRLKELRISLAWTHLLIGRVAINSLVIVEPRLAFERLRDGRFRISGFNPLEIQKIQMPSEQDGFIQWLFAQRELVIDNGELIWQDYLHGGDGLQLTQVSMSVRNSGRRHQVGVRATFPKSLCESCAVVADVEGNPLTSNDWTGRAYLEAVGLNSDRLPPIIRNELPAEFSGRFNLRLWSDWRNNRPRQVKGEVGVTDLRVPVSGLQKPLGVRQARADMSWRGGADTWRLDLDGLTLALAGKPWAAGNLRLEQRFEDTVLRLKRIDLDDVSQFLAGLEQKGEMLDHVRALHPTGAVKNLKLILNKNWVEKPEYVAEADLERISVTAYGDFPGLIGVSGRLNAHSNGGEFVLDASAGALKLPKVFLAPLGWNHAEAKVRWLRNNDYWQLTADKIRVQSADGNAKGALELRLPHDNSAPFLKMRFDFQDLNGAHAARYYPKIIPAKVRTWLERAIVAGTGTKGHLIFNGNVDDFPFHKGNGKFVVSAHVSNALFEYLPGWPLIEQGEVDLLFSGPEMLITASSGRIGALTVNQVVVSIDDLDRDENQEVRIKGRAVGPLDDTLKLLYAAPDSGWRRHAIPGLRGDGIGTLMLDIALPLPAEKMRMAGEYHFQHANLNTPVAGLNLTGIDGHLAFDEEGITASSLTARMLGGPVNLRAETAAADKRTLTVYADGRLSAEGLIAVVGAKPGSWLEGAADWRGRIRVTDGIPNIFWESELQGLRVALPPPFEKQQDASARVSASTVNAFAGQHVIDVGFAERLIARLAFSQDKSRKWSFHKGHVNIGGPQARLPDKSGLTVAVHASRLDGDRWMDVIKQLLRPVNKDGSPPILRQVSADIAAFRFLGTDWGAIKLDIGKWAEGWHGRVQGETLAGGISLPGNRGERDAIHMNLDYLNLPSTEVNDRNVSVDPRDLPALSITADSLTKGGKHWGAAEFVAYPVSNGWQIDRLRVDQPHLNLQANGKWRMDAAGKTVTEMAMDITSIDLGKSLDFLGFPDEVAGGSLKLNSNWSWEGGPYAFDIGSVDGELTIAADKGRLLKMQQGAGRLLGVLNVSSILRYLSLDFSGIFGKGFNFDTIRGSVDVEGGNAASRVLVIKGPSANILIAGRVGLAAHDLDLDIGVTPRFGEELTITSGILGGPAVGAAVALMQGLLKPQIEKSTRIHYRIIGSWDDPNVTKLKLSEEAESAADK